MEMQAGGVAVHGGAEARATVVHLVDVTVGEIRRWQRAGAVAAIVLTGFIGSSLVAEGVLTALATGAVLLVALLLPLAWFQVAIHFVRKTSRSLEELLHVLTAERDVWRQSAATEEIRLVAWRGIEARGLYRKYLVCLGLEELLHHTARGRDLPSVWSPRVMVASVMRQRAIFGGFILVLAEWVLVAAWIAWAIAEAVQAVTG